MIKVWNTLTEKKEKLPIRTGKPLRLFVCGPTVYDHTHIGHLRTYVFFDFFVKYLRAEGYKVQYLQNITDIDDKIIRRAKETRENPLVLSRHLTEEYERDMHIFGVNSVDTYARATEFIPQILEQVTRLMKKGFAYEISKDGIYFDIAKFKDYGKLSHRTLAQAEDSVSRIDDSLGKHNKGDFCLWKFSKPGEPVWDSPLFGGGRPGWHIEDTAISEHFFGPQYEIHGGGMDLKFPHHEAEIAQQEAASGKMPFVRLWMHTGMLAVGGEKMSKSLGNFITAEDFLKRHPPEVFRLLSLSSHYRTPLDYTDAAAAQREEALESVRLLLGKLSFLHARKPLHPVKRFSLTSYERKWKAALADDLNTPQALAAVFEAVREANILLWHLQPSATRALESFITSKLGFLGILLSLPTIPPQAEEYAEKREVLRRNQQFIQSDALRKQIEELGYLVEDTPIGPFLWLANPKKTNSNSPLKI